MPDWVHPLVLILVWAGITWLFSLWLPQPLGFFTGLVVGRLVASMVVRRLPGFWGPGLRPRENANQGQKRDKDRNQTGS